MFNITKKIAFSYFVIAVTSLVAIVYALSSLRSQTDDISHIVEAEFRALTLSGDLNNNVLAQETLSKQFAILRNPELMSLLDRREQEFDTLWRELEALPQVTLEDSLRQSVADYLAVRNESRLAVERAESDLTQSVPLARLSALRNTLLQRFDLLRESQDQHINAELRALSTRSDRAYRWTAILVVLGLLIGAPIAISVAISIHRSVGNLIGAFKTVGAGGFDLDLGAHDNDEFGDLARELLEMGHKLRELEKDRLDANPLTHLPGNLAINRELERRIDESEPFAHAYVDLDNFKAFNDRYGYQRGSDVIAWVGDTIRATIAAQGTQADLVGHVGGDDYVILTTPDRAELVAKDIIERFDVGIRDYYTAEDRAARSFVAKDRFGVERDFPLMSMSIAVVCSGNVALPNPLIVSRECAKMKDHLKKQPGSNYLIDRRRER